MVDDVDIRLYGSDGKRKYFPTDQVSTLFFEMVERGGMGVGGMQLVSDWTDLALRPSVDDRVDVRIFGTLAYRGWVRVAQSEVGSAERGSPTLYGLMERLGGWVVNRRYAWSEPVDVSTAFSAVLDDWVRISGRLPSLVVDVQTIGVKVQTFDAVGKSVAAAFGQLCDLAPGLCIWGCDVDGSGADRAYLRPRTATVARTYSVGRDVDALVYPRDSGAVVNRLYLKGGRAAQPNLLPNASFEYPLPNSETIGNLLLDYSFESGGWSLAFGATIKTGPGDYPNAPRSGSSWLEIDGNLESAEQIVTGIDYTIPLTCSCWARYEDAVNSVGRTFTLEVEGLSAANAVVTTVTVANAQDPGGVVWKRYSGTVDFSAFSTVVKARVRVRAHAGANTNDGILIEDMALIEKNGTANSGWRYSVAGAAKRETLDWANRGVTPYHGGNCVKVDISGVGGGSDCLEIRTALDSRPKVKGSAPYVLAVFLRNDGTNNGSCTIGVSQYKSDGTAATADVESSTITVSSANWTLSTLTFTANSAAVAVEVWIRDRGNAILYIDALALIEGSLPSDWYTGGYWPGENYERRVSTNDVPPSVPGRAPAGLSVGASGSIGTYGERELVLDLPSVVDEATAMALAIGYFNVHAVPAVGIRLSAIETESLPGFGGTVRVVGLPSAPAAQFPSRWRVSVGEKVSVDMDLGEPQADMADLLKLLEKRRT